MTTPPADVIASLAPSWEAIAVHEVGHAVAGIFLGIPISHLTLTYEQVGLLRQWVVRGRTEVVGGTVDGEDHEALRFALAGLEAEAMWISSTTGTRIDRVRHEVESRHANQGDVQEINGSLPGSGWTLDQAVAWCHETLHQHWHTVIYLATALRETGYLAGADVADLV